MHKTAHHPQHPATWYEKHEKSHKIFYNTLNANLAGSCSTQSTFGTLVLSLNTEHVLHSVSQMPAYLVLSSGSSWRKPDKEWLFGWPRTFLILWCNYQKLHNTEVERPACSQPHFVPPGFHLSVVPRTSKLECSKHSTCSLVKSVRFFSVAKLCSVAIVRLRAELPQFNSWVAATTQLHSCRPLAQPLPSCTATAQLHSYCLIAPLLPGCTATARLHS